MGSQNILCTCYVAVLAIVPQIFPEIHVATHYESNYRDRDTYYIVDGESVTLVCEYGLKRDEVYDIQWCNVDEDSEVILFRKEGNGVIGTPLEDRGVTWTYTDTSHKLTIPRVNILTDAVRYRCYVVDYLGFYGYHYLNLSNKINGR